MQAAKLETSMRKHTRNTSVDQNRQEIREEQKKVKITKWNSIKPQIVRTAKEVINTVQKVYEIGENFYKLRI